MGKTVGIGACVCDTLYTLPSFPKEDSKARASSRRRSGGGPAATALVAAKKLGADASYIGVLSDDGEGKFLLADFEKYGVDTRHIEVKSGYRSFSSTLLLCEDKSTRTCVFDKGDLPPLELSEPQKKAIAEADILLIDGNELQAAEHAAKIARDHGTLVLYDCGGLYDGVDRLLPLADIMIPSEEFALGHTGERDVNIAAEKLYLRYSPRVLIITRGAKGGIIYDGESFDEYPAFPVSAIDTNGAGDVFHGAYAAAVLFGYGAKKCAVFASAVSALKCTGLGARESAPDFERVKNFLKENGYEL